MWVLPQSFGLSRMCRLGPRGGLMVGSLVASLRSCMHITAARLQLRRTSLSLVSV
jgi:hypothetical protein